jgi:hypothetical protein
MERRVQQRAFKSFDRAAHFLVPDPLEDGRLSITEESPYPLGRLRSQGAPGALVSCTISPAFPLSCSPDRGVLQSTKVQE